MKVAVALAKNILAPLGITASDSAIDAGIQKKMHGPGTTTLIISNEEMNDIMQIIQALEDSNILLKGVAKTIKNESKKTKCRIFNHDIWYFRSQSVGKFIITKRICKGWFWE